MILAKTISSFQYSLYMKPPLATVSQLQVIPCRVPEYNPDFLNSEGDFSIYFHVIIFSPIMYNPHQYMEHILSYICMSNSHLLQWELHHSNNKGVCGFSMQGCVAICSNIIKEKITKGNLSYSLSIKIAVCFPLKFSH